MPLPPFKGEGLVWTYSPDGTMNKIRREVNGTGWTLAGPVSMESANGETEFTMGFCFGPVQLMGGWGAAGHGMLKLFSFCCNRHLNLSNDADLFSCSLCRYNIPISFTKMQHCWIEPSGLSEDGVSLVETWVSLYCPNVLEASLAASNLNIHLLEAMAGSQ